MPGPLAVRLAGQLARPRGLPGTLLGRAMDLANRRCTALAIDLLDPQDGERLLDAGCGTGAALAAVLRRADCLCTGIDPSPAMIAAARRRLGKRVALAPVRIEDLPPSVGPFDAILALNVLYFADDTGAMVRALRRALAPGGRLVGYATHRETMERWSFARAGLHRLFDAPSLISLLEQGGFASSAISVQECAVGPGVRGLLVCARH
ncbi:methyltransferase [Altererythrobacter salegens]|uniref:Methyltransferase n=1 Tax=Croceibacterium salegens TaxID=1737568 RepID=A0A6I4STX6_9SPHN|nr:class I SAM-dependent methyltransferase [Croceibacterium salegens]MXO58390.1 methyltransferase [Croceibacterium salegens]